MKFEDAFFEFAAGKLNQLPTVGCSGDCVFRKIKRG